MVKRVDQDTTPVPTATQEMSRAVSTKQLIHSTIVDLNGNTLGEIDEIIFESGSGLAAYLVIRCGSKGQCILPFEMIEIKRNPLRVTAAVRREVFLGPEGHVGDS